MIRVDPQEILYRVHCLKPNSWLESTAYEPGMVFHHSDAYGIWELENADQPFILIGGTRR